MRLNRLLTYINWSIGAVLVLFLGLVYWFAYRVLPQTSGETPAPVSQAVHITRDSLGVPHIRAASIEDALFAQGYVHAQDRLWQMDALRRLAAGELSEVAGRAALASDEESRRLRIRRIAEAELSRMPAADRATLAAYARGVNFFLETHQNALPVEFTLLGYQPRPWTPVDTLLAGLQMFRELTNSWKDDVSKGAMLAGDRVKVEYLFPVRAGKGFAPGSGDHPGSNAWAISGRLTGSGKPILASDPHLMWSIPSPWYLNHIEAPGLNVTGASLPGIPCVIIGHNDRIAWGVTNLQFDVQDLYTERLNRQTGQYLFRGKVEQARAERELILIKEEKPVEFVNWVTVHGPLWNSGAGEPTALRWLAAEPGVVTIPFLQLDQARNWNEFLESLRRFGGPGQNFVYADVDGNIGYHASGRLPVREFPSDAPLDGSSGKFEWDGLIPFDELPSAFNPASGMIITANQNPFPANYRYRVNGNFASPHRVKQIQALLESRTGWKPNDMLTVQKDVYSGFSHFLARQIVNAYQHRGNGNPGLEPGVALLRDWNGQMEKDLAAPLLATLAFQNFRRMVGQTAAGQAGATYDFSLSTAVIERLLRERPQGWFPDYDQALLRALSDGMEEGRRLQGGNPSLWRYGSYLEIQVNHPVINQVPYLGAYFNVGPVPMSGSSTTIKQTSRRLGPSMRMVADLSDWDRSLQNLTFGQSGQILSFHYKDQWEQYYGGQSYPMRFGNIQGSTLRLSPGK